MKKAKNILWGILLIAAGVLFALKVLNVIDFNIFFDGWWTLIIIIPCAVGIFTESDKLGSIIGVAIGVFLLLCCQDVLSFELLSKLLLPAIVIIIGIRLVIGGLFGNKANELFNKMKENGLNHKEYYATFSSQNISFNGELFESAELNAVFGGVKCDLSGAVIDKDCAVKVSAIFGGITILVPENVNVKVGTNSIFGGVTNKAESADKNRPTIYISGTCMFGGVDIK
ncbi:MAG: hypothetical protein IJZ35_01110 [Clostridia bacterium]|nr:hypothetical protein [Clostridia bacterium]